MYNVYKHYKFEDGKYEVVRNSITYEVQIKRNGERWLAMEDHMKHCKLFHAMLNEIDDLSEKS